MITVAVSGINAIDNPGPGTGIARCLRESDLQLRLIGLAYDAMEPGIFMDWLINRSYILPYPSSNSRSFIERLSYIHEREHIDVIIPALDVEIPLYLRMERELAESGIRLMIPARQSLQMRGKDKLTELGTILGCKTPKTSIITDPSDAADGCREIGFPCMIKGPFYEAVRVNGIDEAVKTVHDIAARWGFPVLIQEIIVGDEYNCAGLGDGCTEIGLVAVKKVATTKLGKAWSIVSVSNTRILEIATSLVQKLRWRGGFELEMILERDSHEFYCIEINPRFPAWIYLTQACGVNLPERMVRSLLGMPFEKHSNYSAGKLMVRYTSEMIRDIEDLEHISMKAEI